MGPVRLELARLQNKAAIEISQKKALVAKEQTSKTMQGEIDSAKKHNELSMLGKFAAGIEGLQFGPKITSPDWWSSFLSGESGNEISNEDKESEAMEAMQHPIVKSFKNNM